MSAERRLEFHYHWGMQLFALLFLVVPLGGVAGLILAMGPKHAEVQLILGGVCAVFAAMSVPLAWEALAWQLAVSDEGLHCRSPWRGSWLIAWDDVRRLEWSQLGMWFIVKTGRGRWFRFSYTVGDRGRLLEEFERRLKPEQMQGAEVGYLYIGRPFPFRRALPITMPGVPAAKRRPIPGVDLSKWNDRRG